MVPTTSVGAGSPKAWFGTSCFHTPLRQKLKAIHFESVVHWPSAWWYLSVKEGSLFVMFVYNLEISQNMASLARLLVLLKSP